MQNFNQKKLKPGFTLIETLLYVSLTSIILISISVFLGLLQSSKNRNEVLNELDQQAVHILDSISYAVNASESITLPAQGGAGSSLSLATSTPETNPTVINLSGGVVQITEGVGAGVALSSSPVAVTNLIFQNLSPSSTTQTVRFQFDISYINPGGSVEQELTKTYYGSALIR